MGRNLETKRKREKKYYHDKYKNKKIEQVTRWRKEKLYGLTEEMFQSMLEQQDYSCKICGVHQEETYKGLHVDHCHDTLQVRGLLCYKCNTGLGQFNDNPELLNKAKEYLIGSYPNT